MPESRPTTVLLLADYGGPYGGSFIPAVRAIAAMTRKRGWDLECGFTPVARDRPWLGDLAVDGIRSHIAPSSQRGELRAWLGELAGRTEGNLILHTHFTAFDLPAAAVARSRPDVAVIWHVHSFLPGRPVRAALAAVKYGWLGRRVDRILCAGETPARSVRRRGARAATVAVLLNGIDTARFSRIEPGERQAARASLGLADEAPVLLHFAWDWEVKGGPLFAQTLQALRDAGAGAVGVSVGGGQEAAAAGERLGLGDALRAPGPDQDVRRFYAAADAFMAMSRDEGNPFSIIEALSCGLPVVGTDIPGHRIEEGGPAALRLAAPAPGALAELTRSVLGRPPAEREREAAAASDWVAAHRSLGAWAASVISFYEQAMPGAGAP